MGEYGYMLKSIIEKDGKLISVYDSTFIYPKKKGALIEAKNWDPEPECSGGIYGLIHETEDHHIVDYDVWLILKYKKSEAVIVDGNKIKVPRAWMVAWGNKEEIQRQFERLTGKEYTYDYAIQITSHSKKTQKAWNKSVQIAKEEAIQKAGFHSVQIGGDFTKQTIGSSGIQIAGICSAQRGGGETIQIAGWASIQEAERGSISILRDKQGYCQHDGKVLQILVFYDYEDDGYVFLTKIIADDKRHHLRAVKVDGEWKLYDRIIEDEELKQLKQNYEKNKRRRLIW